MISKREEADRQFSKLTRKIRIEEERSKSITDADKAAHDSKTARLKKQREAKEAGEAETKKRKR